MRVTVFGLDVSADMPLSFLDAAPARPTGRKLDISVADGNTTVPERLDSARLVCDQRQPSGDPIFSIEAHPNAGYFISGPQYGAHLLSTDGRRLQCFPNGHPEDVWQRLLIAQVLPFAALLQGLEILHASAVATDRGAVACIGTSHAGKTSVALALCRRGARFIADDVLALEYTGEDLLGHPGAPLAGLDHAEAQRLTDAGGAQPQEIVTTNAREQLVRMRGVAEPTPLRALFLLERHRDAPGEPRFGQAAQTPGGPRFEPVTDPQPLLAATFNTVLTTPARLRGLLDVCAFAVHQRVERVTIGPGVDATQLAAAIEQRLGTST